MTEVPPGIYEHFKGGKYEVLGEGIDTETREPYVVYKPLYDVPNPKIFQLRPKAMFLGEVEIDGQKVPRFKLLDEVI